ncbi:hypothetical protein F0562_017619 [Nyssa sinensis]|uniref:Uncharacterized protein n=1 Tax=Nyssa sinensis TaxID=561372 RepID=A0A5J4ZIK2_9ASTE|nr:hypothetical protein F0562_017619 [Nyssa sinensis]
MAPRLRLATQDQFSFAISLVSRLRNPPSYWSAIARTRCCIIQSCEFWPERYARLDQIAETLAFFQFSTRGWLSLLSISSPLDEPLVREFYMNLDTVRDQVTACAFVHGISFDLTLALLVETLGIPHEDQPGFPYALGTTPREEVLARALCCDRVSRSTHPMLRELFKPFTRRTLMQSRRHVGLIDTNAAKDIEAGAAEAGGAVPDEDYLVD